MGGGHMDRERQRTACRCAGVPAPVTTFRPRCLASSRTVKKRQSGKVAKWQPHQGQMAGKNKHRTPTGRQAGRQPASQPASQPFRTLCLLFTCLPCDRRSLFLLLSHSSARKRGTQRPERTEMGSVCDRGHGTPRVPERDGEDTDREADGGVAANKRSGPREAPNSPGW